MLQFKLLKFCRIAENLDARFLSPLRAFFLKQRVLGELRKGDISSQNLLETLAIFQVAKSLEQSRQVLLSSQILRQIIPKLEVQDEAGFHWRDAREALAESCYKQKLYQEAESLFCELALEEVSDAMLPKRMYLYRLISLAELRSDLTDQVNWQRVLVDLCQKNLSKTSLCRLSAEADLAKSEMLLRIEPSGEIS